MAEQQAVTETVADPNAAAEGEAQTTTTETVENDDQQTDPIEALASDIGWTPKEQFKGDPEKWKPADEFIRASKDIQQSMSKELREVKTTVSNMSRVSQQLLAEKLAERDSYWQGKQAEAFEAGDAVAFNRAANERASIHAQSPGISEPAELAAFKDKHGSWLGIDPEATNFAYSVCEMNKNLPADQQLAKAEAAVRKRFPEHFQTSPRGKQAPQVSEPADRMPSKSNGKKGFNDLPPAAQKAAKDFEANHGVKREDYAARYFQREGAGR